MSGTRSAQRGAMRFLPCSALPAIATVLLALGGCGGTVAAFDQQDGGVDGATDAAETSIARETAVDPARPDARPVPTDTMPTFPDAIVEDLGPSGCNSLPNTATMIASKTVVGTAPAAYGGFITPGIYHLTDVTFFSAGVSLPPFSMKMTMQLGAGTLNTAHQSSMDDGRSTSTYSIAGTQLNLSQTCPKVEATTMDFTATPSSLVFYFHIMEEGFSGTLRYTMAKVG